MIQNVIVEKIDHDQNQIQIYYHIQRDFIVNYSLKAGITESENEAHQFVDHLFAAEEVIEGNIDLQAVVGHYEIEQEDAEKTVETGLNKYGEDEVLEIEGAYSPEDSERFSNEEHQVS